MASKAIKITTLAATLAIVALVEWTAPGLVRLTGLPVMTALGLVRLIEMTAMIVLIVCFENGLDAVGWAPRTWLKGLGLGFLWSLGFALVTAATMAGIYALGYDPLEMLRMPLPRNSTGLTALFLVGGLISPLAEEICFRGLVYSFFRRWGMPTALGVSTLIFVALHLPHGFPLVQIIGGIVFAAAFELTRNLMVPMVIHVTGNCAIFALSLPWLAG